MTVTHYLKYFVALLAVVSVFRFFSFEATLDQQPLESDARIQSQDLPALTVQRDQRLMRDKVLANGVWGWPKEKKPEEKAAEPDPKPKPKPKPKLPAWQLVGVVFDGAQWQALLWVEQQRERGTQKFVAGDTLPSGQVISAIFENEMLITVADKLLKDFVSQAEENQPTPYAKLQKQVDQGKSEVLVKVGFNFEQ